MKAGCESKNNSSSCSISLPVLPSTPNGARKPRTNRRRAAVLIAVNLLMVAHFIQWRLMGTTVSPIEPSEAMYTLQNGAITAGFIFFSLAIIATMIFGRFVCGWGCHILALQDLCAWLLKRIPLAVIGLCAIDRGPLYVRLADSHPSAYQTSGSAFDTGLYQPSRYNGILGNISTILAGSAVPFHLRFRYRVLSRV